MTTGILAMLISFASITNGPVEPKLIQDNMPRIKYILKMVEEQLEGSCNVLGPLNSKDNRLISLGVGCEETIGRRNYRYYYARIIIDLKTKSFVRLRD